MSLKKLGQSVFLTKNTFSAFSRPFSSSSVLNEDVKENKEGWFSKLQFVRRIEPTKESHSRMLSDKEVIFELHTHNVRPDSFDKYITDYENQYKLVQSQNLSCELVGSWTVQVGDVDQALHLWKYKGGFASIDKTKQVLRNSTDFQALNKALGQSVRSRHLQFLLAFSYWPSIVTRAAASDAPTPNIYEVRSYSLKPGTMIEWGNNWARAINHRRNNDEAFAGFFSQVGRLYNVHHFWCYKDMQARKETRESAWRSPGWDECVAYTVPLIREMQSRILLPNSFSPTQ